MRRRRKVRLNEAKMYIRMLLPLSCLIGLIAGFLIMVSPFYITGGIVCWLHPVPPDAWFNHLLGLVFSVLIGLVVIAGSGFLAVTTGIIFAVEASVNTKARCNGNGSPSGPNDDKSTAAAKNVDSLPTQNIGD